MSRFCTQLRYFSRRCDQGKIVVWSPHYHAPITFQRKKFLSTKWLEKKNQFVKKIEIVFFFEGVCKISLNKIGKLFTATLSIAKKIGALMHVWEEGWTTKKVSRGKILRLKFVFKINSCTVRKRVTSTGHMSKVAYLLIILPLLNTFTILLFYWELV